MEQALLNIPKDLRFIRLGLPCIQQQARHHFGWLWLLTLLPNSIVKYFERTLLWHTLEL
jgi:hypothetical protein